jgi:hypothetical protein
LKLWHLIVFSQFS